MEETGSCNYQAGMSRQRFLASQTTYNRLTTPGKQPPSETRYCRRKQRQPQSQIRISHVTKPAIEFGVSRSSQSSCCNSTIDQSVARTLKYISKEIQSTFFPFIDSISRINYGSNMNRVDEISCGEIFGGYLN